MSNDARSRSRSRTRTIHVAIGNSDDKLSQRRWHEFVGATDIAVRKYGDPIYGFWVSPSDAPFQNAAWAFQVHSDADRDALRELLIIECGNFDQDSIAWNESHTEFLRPDGSAGQLADLFEDDTLLV